MSNPNSILPSLQKYITVSGNHFNYADYGIRLNLYSKLVLNIFNNEINLNSSGFSNLNGKGITLETFNSLLTSQIPFNPNEVDLYSPHIYNNQIEKLGTGIYLNRTPYAEVYGNRIKYESGGGLKYGIRAVNVWGLNLHDHSGSNSYIEGSSIVTNSKGIDFENCNKFKICDNHVKTNGQGITVEGSTTINSAAITITCNEMESSQYGFGLLGNANIGSQPLGGGSSSNNQWTPSNYYNTGNSNNASHTWSNSFYANKSTFYTYSGGTCENTNNLPPNNHINNFHVSGSCSNNCPNITCPEFGFPAIYTGVINILGSAITNVFTKVCPNPPCRMEDEVEDTIPVYDSPEELFIAKQEVYRILLSDTTLKDSSELFTEFLDTCTSNNIGKLQEIEDYIAITSADTASTADSLINYFYGLIQDNTWEGGIYSAEYLIAKNILDSLLISKYYFASSANDDIVPENIVVSNQKTYNDILLKTMLLGVDTFTNSQIEDLWNIAHQCPKYGGLSVYNARAMLGYALDTIIDYPDTCTINPSYRLEQKHSKTIGDENNNSGYFKVYPNPSNNLLLIKYMNSGDEKGATRMKVTDIIGREIKSLTLEELSGKTQMSVTDFREGIYFVTWMDNKGIKYQQKVIIIHSY